MKTSCQITKDLLPLVVDEIASDDTRAYVDEHLAFCENCQKTLELLRKNAAGIGASNVEEEEQLFERAVAAMRKKRIKRTAGKILLGALIGLVLLFGFFGAKQELYDNRTAVQMDVNDYDIRLSQLSDGRIMGSVKLLGKHTIGGWGTSISEGENGVRVLQLKLWTSILPHAGVNADSYQQLMILDLSDCDTVCIGNGEKTIWRRGEKIPEASQEMEAYLMKSKELQLLYAEEDHAVRISHIMGTYGEDQAEQAAAEERAANAKILEEELSLLLPKVPEWKNE